MQVVCTVFIARRTDGYVVDVKGNKESWHCVSTIRAATLAD